MLFQTSDEKYICDILNLDILNFASNLFFMRVKIQQKKNGQSFKG